MKIKLNSSKILLLIIAVLVIYLLFFSNTSGYGNNDAKDEGYSDVVTGSPIKTRESFRKLKRGKYYSQYEAGVKAGRRDLMIVSGLQGSSSGDRKSIKRREDANKRINAAKAKAAREQAKKMKKASATSTVAKSTFSALKSTFTGAPKGRSDTKK